MHAKAAAQVFRGIISATDPTETVGKPESRLSERLSWAKRTTIQPDFEVDLVAAISQ